MISISPTNFSGITFFIWCVKSNLLLRSALLFHIGDESESSILSHAILMTTILNFIFMSTDIPDDIT